MRAQCIIDSMLINTFNCIYCLLFERCDLLRGLVTLFNFVELFCFKCTLIVVLFRGLFD